jgi:hypothetical protein
MCTWTGHQEGATQVDVHDGIPVLQRHLEDQIIADDAGVVDQDGRGAELKRDLFHGSLDPLGRADVDCHSDGSATGRGNRRHRLGARGLVKVQDGNGVPIPG